MLLTRTLGLTFLLALSAQPQGLGTAPHPILDAADIYSVFKLPVNDAAGRPPGDAASQTQVGIRARTLGLTSHSAVS
ncbi:MAG: hypothetical protein M3N54_11750, partial [Acidobacteriota bacterium]|nr:hypothetical protein [Acidobacteriota bacterium]